MNKSKTTAQTPAQKGSQKVPTGPTSWKDRISEQDY